jgi:hypothetical protein
MLDFSFVGCLLDVIFHIVLVSALLPLLRLGEWRSPRRTPLLAVLVPTLYYSHICLTTSVVVELTYAGFILSSFPFLDVELIRRKG